MAPKIYHLHPLAAGPLERWAGHFARVRSLGFSHVCVAPPFLPGESGDIFLPADIDVLHPALGFSGPAPDGIAAMARAAAQEGLDFLLDVTLDRLAAGAPVSTRQPGWFTTGGCGGLPDPRRPPHRLDVAYARFGQTEASEGLVQWWIDHLGGMLRAGVAGFRCLEPDRVPGLVWRRIIATLRGIAPRAFFLAWTPGAPHPATSQLAGAGFDRVCASVAWWDRRAPWLVEEIEFLRAIAPALGSPEPSFADRLIHRLPAGSDFASAYRQALRVAASVCSGLFVPMGFEFATRHPFDAARATEDDFLRARGEAPFDLSHDIVAANSLTDRMAALDVSQATRSLTAPDDSATALLRTGSAECAALVLINPSPAHATDLPFALSPLPPQSGRAFGAPEPVEAPADPQSPLAPGEVRVLAYSPTPPVRETGVAGSLEREPLFESRIAIEAVSPQVPGGNFATKCVIGEAVAVSADIFADGHEVLAADVLWRAADENTWQRAAMRPTVNDRWEAAFTPGRVGPHLFTVEAWWDVWGTFRHDLHAKHAAGQIVTLEIEEGRRLLDAACKRASGAVRDALRGVLDNIESSDEAARIPLLLSERALKAMQSASERPFAARPPALRLQVDRPQARFASWYELFPRSVTSDPSRHGTFLDVIARLPAIRAMGFDVLYFPPIHPIGRANRKGRNNALRAESSDVGSPYAIGNELGGHDAVHPALGTLEDFRALLAAAHQEGLEIALDFAIQCSPDHPWLKQHPDWFRWRPDGSMRYAENPPKKYEDIVNPDFYLEAAVPSLWYALRDVIQFWVDQGVRIFRVDNPHTKPLPFWQWMIADIKDRHPEVIFLSEAFTRPKMMYRLAKAGFTQSYTYFTWRNTKHEITDYLTELNIAPARDFFRPNFFVNTPDINPYFLQSSGRAGFLIRAALACTLSGLWGMYSGFEVCEAAPLPGREEYLDSEKYEIRVRDYAAPGNIVAEITALNHIRRAHPALQTHLGVAFHSAWNDQVILFSKRASRTGSRSRDMVLVAISFDPHNIQEATIEVPLWEFGMGDNGSVDVVDLMSGHRFTWYGKTQQIRLDPSGLPFAIWQLTPPGAYR
jgi:starch synthase (maltosyl-transferring)